MNRDTAAISFDDVSVERGGHMLWSGASWSVAQGNFVAVLGPNGAGKSSMLGVILGQLRTASGRVAVLGDAPGAHKDRIGYLPQRRSFDRSMRLRGRDVVHFGIDGDHWGVPIPFIGRAKQRLNDEAVDRAIDIVGANVLADRPIGEVSGGEQQRLLIAQALVRSPDVLLLDEPLDSLDLPNQHAIASLVREVSETHGTTVVMVAHDVNPVLPYLDQVIYVAGGRVVAGSPQEVVQSDVLSALYDTPIEVLTTTDGRQVVVGAPDEHTHHAHR